MADLDPAERPAVPAWPQGWQLGEEHVGQPGVEHLAQLRQRIDFDLDAGEVGGGRACALQRFNDRAGRGDIHQERHPLVQAAHHLGLALGQDLGPYDGHPGIRGRPGGWWILFEPELHFEADVLVVALGKAGSLKPEAIRSAIASVNLTDSILRDAGQRRLLAARRSHGNSASRRTPVARSSASVSALLGLWVHSFFDGLSIEDIRAMVDPLVAGRSTAAAGTPH